ncbi:hypothetical protein KVM76_06380 [Helicobacter pylori]|nr:hypothetical protein KVM76_06380 [Helicobacter pylori]
MGRFVVSKKKKKKKGFWGVLEPFSIIKKVLKFVLIGIAVKMGVLIAWWDRFRLGCKTLQGGIKITFPLDF